jgi:hypothetical protein
MPILGVPASLGKPEQLSAKSAGGRCACASVNGQRDARESGEIPLLSPFAPKAGANWAPYPATVSDVLSKSGRPLPHGGKVSGRQVAESGDRSRCGCTCSSSEGKENCHESIRFRLATG